MRWEWFLAYDDEGTPFQTERTNGENSDVCSFVNGSWILSVRDFIGQAQAAKEAYNLANSDAERVALLDELLVGRSV